jgi:glucan phosphorylase
MNPSRPHPSLQLRAKLPAPLRSLADFAYNYWWSWTPERISLFSVIDPALWQQQRHNPVALLESVTQERLWQLAEDPEYLKRLHLEREIVRLYYDCDRSGIPHSWVKRMKASLRTLAPRFNTHRMVSEYVTQLYAP